MLHYEKIDYELIDESLSFLQNYVNRTSVHANPTTTVLHNFRSPPDSLTASFSSARLQSPSTTRMSSPTPTTSTTTSTVLDSKQQFFAVVSFLRKRYSADPTDVSGIDTFTDEDVAALCDCFGRELRSAAHKERTRLALLREGGGKKVNFPPSDLLHASSIAPQENSDEDRNFGADERAERNDKKRRERLKVANPSHDEAPATADTPPVNASSASEKGSMSLREGMKMLRKGECVTKFSKAGGKPQRRFLRVMDRKVDQSQKQRDDCVVPHLCWSLTATTDPGTSQLSLLTLRKSSYGVLSHIGVQKDAKVTGEMGEMIPLDCCVSLLFDSRGALDVAFRSPETAKLWADVFSLIVSKNAAANIQKDHPL